MAKSAVHKGHHSTGELEMRLFKITGCVAALALALPSTSAGAAADQKNNRGYVVGKGGITDCP